MKFFRNLFRGERGDTGPMGPPGPPGNCAQNEIESFEQGCAYASAQRDAEIIRLRGVVTRLQEIVRKQQKELLGVPESFDLYHAQNQVDLLRTIRRSQGEAINKLQAQLKEACAERDAASIRANDWRGNYNRVLSERDSARTAFNKACDRVRELIKERDEMNQEMDSLCRALAVSQAVNRITALREKYNPRLESMLEESYRNEFKRNIDNQKASDSPNCPSS